MRILSTNELYKLSTAELKEVTMEQIFIANKNIKELEVTGYASLSQAYQSLSRRQGREKPSFSTNLEGLDRPQLVARYTASSSYNSLRTASVFGTRDVNVEIYKNLGYDEEKAKEIVAFLADQEREGKYESEDGTFEGETIYGVDIRMFWKLYKRIEEGTELVKDYDSFFVQSKLWSYIEETGDYSIEGFTKWFEETTQKMDEERNRQEQEENERKWGNGMKNDF